MSESGTEVLERPAPMIANPERMREMRERLHRELYEEKMPPLPEKKGTAAVTEKALMDKLNEQVEELGRETQEKEQKEKEQGRAIPDIVLRQEKSWEKLDIGWKDDEKAAVKQKFKSILGIGDSAADHAMECLVAEGKTAREILQTLDNPSILQQVTEDVEGQLKGKSEREINNYVKYTYLQKIGIEKEDYIRRFVLNKEFVNELHREYTDGYAQNLYDLAWNMGFNNDSEFGINGKFPMLQMQIEKYLERDDDGKVVTDENGKPVEKVRGRYVVNQGNFMRWLKWKIWDWYDFETDEATNYFSNLNVDKGNFTKVSLQQMIFEHNTYFRDETGHKWGDLYAQALLEPWMTMFLRTYHVEYKNAERTGDTQKLAEAYKNIFNLSKLTRKIYGKSMVYYLTTLPVDFQGKDSDTVIGKAWSKMFLAYYNMADFEGLQNVLGKDSSFFTKEGWLSAIGEVYKTDILGTTGMQVLRRFLGDKTDSFFKAFDADGNVTEETKDDFIKFVNVFNGLTLSSTANQVIAQALMDTVKDQVISKEGNEADVLDEHSLKFAWLHAHSWTLWSGAATRNNFPEVSGHNPETKWQHTEAYRSKYVRYSGAGKQQTVRMLKRLSMDFMQAIQVENSPITYTVNGDTQTRKASLLEIFMQMHDRDKLFDGKRAQLQEQKEKVTSEEEKRQVSEKLALLDEEEKNEHKQIASQFEFDTDVMQNFADNNIGRAKVLYDMVFGAEEIDFDKFIKFDSIFRGVSFDRAAFQKAIGGVITPLRYLFEAGGTFQANMMVREPVYTHTEKGKDKWEYREIPLIQAFIGYEALNIPRFRREAHYVSPEEMKANGWKKRGKYLKDADGRFVLDYGKMTMTENRKYIWKQWLLMKLGADLWSHIDRHSTDPAYGMDHYMNVLQAIETLPGEFAGDEFDMKNTRITEPFFDKHQMEWLARLSGTTKTQLFNRQFWADIFTGDKRKKESLLGEPSSIFLSTIFRGY